MKNILVATDFSENAKTAAFLAAELARYTEARLIVFHAFHPISGSEKKGLQQTGQDPEKETQARLDALAYELHSRYGVSITRLIKPGYAADEISALAWRTRAELVVMGAHGHHNLPGASLGEVAGELLTKASLPLVCVPADASAQALKYLVLLLNERPELSTEAGLKKLNELSLLTSKLKPAVE